MSAIEWSMPLRKYLRKGRRIPLRALALFALAVLVLPAVSGQAGEQEKTDPVFLMDVPLVYGEENFIRRIEHPASGRDKPLGLLLSGGSARAFAHIGALKRLDEEGLSPDFIVTDSMGSIVGLLYGAGLSPDTILQLVKDTELSRLFEPELPLSGGILDPSTFLELLQSVLDIDDISELAIPVIVVCEDIRSKRTVILAEGDFEKVLGASFALPVYFKPVELFGRRLIDGGISNLVPASIPYRYTDDVIVSTTFYRKELNLNNPLTILNVAMDITKSRAGVSAIKRYNPGLIRCDVESFSFMDFGKLDEIVARGYESAERAIAGGDGLSRFERVPAEYLRDVRAEMDTRVRAGMRRYRRIGTVSYGEPGVGVKLGPEFRGGPDADTLLISRNGFSLGADIRSGYLSAGVRAFIRPRWMNPGVYSATSLPGVSFSLSWHAAALAQLTFESDLLFDVSSESPPRFGSLYGRGTFYLPLFSGTRWTFGPHASFEGLSGSLPSLENYLWTAGLKLTERAAAGKIGGGMTEAGFFADGTGTAAVYAKAGASVSLLPFLSFSQRLVTRLPLPWSGDVPFYPSDYFRGSDGKERFESLVITNSSFGFSIPGWTPTFAEMLILDSLSAGPFFDLRYDGDSFACTLGGELSALMSFIGLKPFTLHFDAGWASLRKGPVFSFYVKN